MRKTLWASTCCSSQSGVPLQGEREHPWEVSLSHTCEGATLTSHQKPRAGPSQQHPNSKALRRGFCPRQKHHSSDPQPCSRNLPAAPAVQILIPPAKSSPSCLHLKSVWSWGLLLPARPLWLHREGFCHLGSLGLLPLSPLL